MNAPIYLDYNATTPLDPKVLEAMLPYLTSIYGNPSSGHWAGQPARAGIEVARQQVATLMGCDPDEIVFTGGASEANNLCIKGVGYLQRERPGRSILTSVVEHASVSRTCDFLVRYEGFAIHQLGVDEHGRVRLPEQIPSDTTLVTVMLAQNEVGTLQPVHQLVEAVRTQAPQAIVHTDASQAGGKIPFKVRELGVDMCVIAAHKFYGPKGTAAAYIRRGLAPEALVHGVGHEAGRRAGTENVAGIVGIGRACELALERMAAVTSQQRRQRDRLWEGLRKALPEAVRQGHPSEVLPNTLNVCLPHIDTTTLLQQIGHQLAVSNGAACHWGVTAPSVVLTAMGVPRHVALGAIRFSLGKDTTDAEVDAAVKIIQDALTARRLS